MYTVKAIAILDNDGERVVAKVRLYSRQLKLTYVHSCLNRYFVFPINFVVYSIRKKTIEFLELRSGNSVISRCIFNEVFWLVERHQTRASLGNSGDSAPAST